MRRTWFHITVLSQFFVTLLVSAATLPPSLRLISTANLYNSSHELVNWVSNLNPHNGSHKSVQCLARSNVTYPIYDSPLVLAMTLGHRPILSWQVTTFIEYVIIAIKGNAAKHPHEYMPDGYYYYHEQHRLGAISVIPSFYRNFTWSDLYLVLHGLAEYIVTAPRAYEMCVEINFKAGGLAGVIFLDWWTSDVPGTRDSR